MSANIALGPRGNRNRRTKISAYIVVLTASLALSACSTTYVKPGATPGEWEQDKAACMLQAMKEVPADNRYSLAPGQEYSSRDCAHGGKDCASYSTYTPPQIVTTDANADVRRAVFQACLAKRGWLEQTH